jgi:hypothetical protein
MQALSVPAILSERPRSLSFLAVVREGLDDLTFEPPQQWSQRTIVGFNAPNPDRYVYPPGVVVTRDTMADGDTLESIVERHLVELLQLTDVQIASPRKLDLDGQPAIVLEYEWTTETCVLAQTSTIVASCTGMRRTVTTFTTFCATEDTSELRPLFGQLFDSVRFAPPYVATRSDVAPVLREHEANSDIVPAPRAADAIVPPPPGSDATVVTITSVLDVEDSFKEAYGESFYFAPEKPREGPCSVPEIPILGTRAARGD